MGFVARVRRTLEQRRLLGRGRGVLVACSGGPDSSALLEALTELAPAFSLDLWAAGVDHGLRPEAGAELQLAREHAEARGVPFRLLAVQVDPSQGRQAGARAARYRALSQLARELGAAHVATGHTLDDQAETVVARLLRSPSVRSLSGVEPLREDGVIRPLIDCRREQVLRFVDLRGLRVAHDPSNRDPAYTRSRVRHQLMPSLLAENPRLVEALGFLADDARAHQGLVERAAAPLDLAAPGARRALQEHMPPVRRWMIATWIRQQTGAAARLEQLRSLDGAAGAEGVLLPGGWVARWRPDGSLAVDIQTKRTRGR